MELDLLTVLKDKDYYDRFNRFVNKHSVSNETYVILMDMKSWFAKEYVLDWPSFSEWFFLVRHPTMKKDKTEIYHKIFTMLHTHYTSSVAEDVIKSFVARDFGERIGDVGMRVAEGGDKSVKLEDIPPMIDKYYDEIGKAAELDSMFVTDDLSEIAEKLAIGTGLTWRLPELNAALGPLRKGDFLIVSARPDSGKTTFLASEGTAMAEQLADTDQRLVWFNNEEDGKKVKWRIYQAALGITSDDMNADITAAIEMYSEMMGGKDRIKVLDNKRLHVSDMEEVLKHTKAGVIVIDQLWKVQGFERDSVSEVDRQTKLFAWAREMASMYAPVITVHQADGSAEGQLWIEMNQLYGSKTGIQGEADAIVTLGKSHESGYEMTRGLYVPKNKMFGEDPTLRNGKFEVIIKPEVARFEGTM